MKKWALVFFAIVSTILLSGYITPGHITVYPDTAVWEVLNALGEDMPGHIVDNTIKGIDAEAGRDIVLYGIADKPGGGETSKQSKHFVCTSCHNIVKEDPDLSVVNPEARLDYANQQNLPFLQGTTLYGVVNRTSYYNGDYKEKYGELVTPARNNLREAIQLCAIDCSQGRKLKDWELESVLAYLWTIQLKMEDLNLSQTEYDDIHTALESSTSDKLAIIDQIKSKYIVASPANFVKPPEDREAGYGYEGNPDRGMLIYKLSCLHCHEKKRYSFFELDDSKLSLKYLAKHFPNYSHASVYQLARYGAPSLYGKRAYMPQYTKEKLSDKQLEDLRAYIETALD